MEIDDDFKWIDFRVFNRNKCKIKTNKTNMDYAISVLNKRIEEINLEVKRLESITEFELSSDIIFIDTELENFRKQKDELLSVTVMLYNKRK
jgi:hypothetical protein